MSGGRPLTMRNELYDHESIYDGEIAPTLAWEAMLSPS